MVPMEIGSPIAKIPIFPRGQKASPRNWETGPRESFKLQSFENSEEKLAVEWNHVIREDDGCFESAAGSRFPFFRSVNLSGATKKYKNRYFFFEES